ncbi:MAG TPA: DUF3159 domain-containing protein [Pseudonocardiaceae bacterium]
MTDEPGRIQPTPETPAVADDPDQPRPVPTLLEQMGGLSGMVASVIPIVVFVVVNAVTGLNPALIAALGSAVAIGIWRLVRKEGVQPAVSGAIGVAISALIAYWVGEAKGFFLYGIWASLVYAGVFALSLLVRRPLIGVIWHGLRGDGAAWRQDRRVVRGYDLATAVWLVVFVARFVVQRWLYDTDQEGALGVARLAMGLPLTALALLVTIWAARRASRLLPAKDEPAADPA